MTEHIPPLEKPRPPRIPIVDWLIVAATLIVLALSLKADARPLLEFDPAWVLMVLPPPEVVECNVRGVRVLGPDGTFYNAAIGQATPSALTAEIILLTSVTGERLICDGFE